MSQLLEMGELVSWPHNFVSSASTGCQSWRLPSCFSAYCMGEISRKPSQTQGRAVFTSGGGHLETSAWDLAFLLFSKVHREFQSPFILVSLLF